MTLRRHLNLTNQRWVFIQQTKSMWRALPHCHTRTKWFAFIISNNHNFQTNECHFKMCMRLRQFRSIWIYYFGIRFWFVIDYEYNKYQIRVYWYTIIASNLYNFLCAHMRSSYGHTHTHGMCTLYMRRGIRIHNKPSTFSRMLLPSKLYKCINMYWLFVANSTNTI